MTENELKRFNIARLRRGPRRLRPEDRFRRALAALRVQDDFRDDDDDELEHDVVIGRLIQRFQTLRG